MNTKFWRRNKIAITGGLIALLALGGFVGLGYAYSKADIGYDYIGVGSQVDSLNYNIGNGTVYRITPIMNEGLIVPGTDYKTLQTEINEQLTSTVGDLVSIEDYREASIEVLRNSSSLYNEEKDNNDRDFDKYNDNEKTLIILASSSLDSEGNIVDGESMSIEKAAEILVHNRPITYIGDDEGETLDSAKWSISSATSFTAFAYGASDAIYTNPEYSAFRFRMRDGSLDDGVSTWSSWDGGEADRVSAGDVAFAFSNQLTSMYGSGGSYMYTSVANLKGTKEALAADTLDTTDPNRYINSTGELLNQKELDQWTAQDAIDYGVARTSTYGVEQSITFDEEFQSFDGDNSVGIVYHDPYGLDEDAAVEVGAEDYSYIDFTPEIGSNTMPTMMASTGFWPINWEWFINEIGRPTSENVNRFGTSEKTLLSNGAQEVTHFDNLYGYSTVKNENYYDADLVTVEKGSYRMIAEASTQVAMFENEQATYIDGDDSNNRTIQDSEETSAWLPSKLTKPSTKYMYFNLGTDRQDDIISKQVRDNAKYTSDPNFRRAFWYLFDANTYHQLNSINTSNPVTTFENPGMYVDSNGNDFVTYMTDVTYVNKGMDSDTTSVSSQQLEYYTYQDRIDATHGVDLEAETPTRSEELADYYFNIFIEDMNTLGVELPEDKVFKLKYLTQVGSMDPYIKTIQQDISSHTFDGGYKIELQIETVPSGSYNADAKAGDYDLTASSWGPDYLDSWSNIGIFNISETSRGSNSTASWNMWDGSDYSFQAGTYGSEENDALARELFNDGFVQFFEGENANILSVEYNETPEKYSVDSVLGTEYVWGDSMDTPSTFQGDIKEVWDVVLSDNGIDSWTPGTAVANSDGFGEQESTNGISYNNHTTDIWSDPIKKMSLNILFEIILKDGAPIIIGSTETGSVSPTRSLLEGDPVTGYPSRTFAFDITKSSSYWKPVKNDLLDELGK